MKSYVCPCPGEAFFGLRENAPGLPSNRDLKLVLSYVRSMPQPSTKTRSTFRVIAPREDVSPNERDIRWFKHLERHGPLSSTQLIAWTADTHRCKDTALRRLQALRAAKLLYLPNQQRQTERAEFKPYVYDLAPLGLQFLKDAGLAENTVRPTGH